MRKFVFNIFVDEKKKTSHFSVEDIIRTEFKKSLSRGTIGKDTHGLLWTYGVLMRDSLYWVEVIMIDLETHKVERIMDKESSHEQREDATVYKGFDKRNPPDGCRSVLNIDPPIMLYQLSKNHFQSNIVKSILGSLVADVSA